jgi:hypothetical protein
LGEVFARKNFSCGPETEKSIQSPVGICKLYVDGTGFCVFRMHLHPRSFIVVQGSGQAKGERGHTYTPDNGGAVRLVAAEEMKQSKSVGMLERELGACKV